MENFYIIINLLIWFLLICSVYKDFAWWQVLAEMFPIQSNTPNNHSYQWKMRNLPYEVYLSLRESINGHYCVSSVVIPRLFYSIPKIIKRRHVFVVVVLGLTLEYFTRIDNIFAGKGLWHLELCPLSCVSHQLWHRSPFCGLIWMTNKSKMLFTTSKGSYGLTLKTWLRGYRGDTEIAF